MQIKQKEEEKIKSNLDELKEEFDSLNAEQETTREVILTYVEEISTGFCGCGGTETRDHTIKRIVDEDSDLEDGDVVYDTEEGDIFL